MALALKKPFVLMIEEGMHKDYWQKTAPHKVHYIFSKKNFKQKAEQAIESVIAKYEEVAMRALRDEFIIPG